MEENKKIVKRGYSAKQAVPRNITYPMTRFPWKDSDGNIIPYVSDEDVYMAKNFVDQNHK